MQTRGRTAGARSPASVLLAALIAAACLILPATGSAATTYPNNSPQASNFDGGDGGWQARPVEYTGLIGGTLCSALPLFLCPDVERTHVPDGGNPNGYLNTSPVPEPIGLLSVAGVSSTWVSPTF